MSFIFIYCEICMVCLCVFAFLPCTNTQRGTWSVFTSILYFTTHTHTQGGFSGCWLMTVICQAEVDKTGNIIFVLRARAHRTLPLMSFISGWTQRHAGTRRQPGSQQIYSHYFSIRTSASTDQALHLYTDIRERKGGGSRVARGREEEWQRGKRGEIGRKRGTL